MDTQLPSILKHEPELPNSALFGMKPTMLFLDTSRASIYRLIASGVLSPVKVGHSVKFRLGDLRALSAGGAQ